ncbi:FMN-binding protein [Lacticaseibacillus nasuensis]|nr:FMN-binding protein [Lacticaseibacillus nasuensis]
MGGKLVVKVTYIDHTIKHIEIVQQHESEDVGLVALQQLPEEMVAQNNTEVDATTGASATSHALQAAVRDAISKSQQ